MHSILLHESFGRVLHCKTHVEARTFLPPIVTMVNPEKKCRKNMEAAAHAQKNILPYIFTQYIVQSYRSSMSYLRPATANADLTKTWK